MCIRHFAQHSVLMSQGTANEKQADGLHWLIYSNAD